MIRSLRRRFILGAMLALAILLVLLNCGIVAGSYWRMERRGDEMLDRLLESPDQSARREHPSERMAAPGQEVPVFGYELPRREPQMAHYVLRVDAEGTILDLDARGVVDLDEAALAAEVSEIVASGTDRGKAGAHKYALRADADGEILLVLLDNSLQLQGLLDTLRMMLVASALGLAGMFVILLPVSRRMVRSYAVNIEKQKQFITNAGHEIKTPVAIIQSNVDALELIQGESKWSRNIRSQVDRLCVLLQELLNLARLDERRTVWTMEAVDLGALVADEVESDRERVSERGLTLCCDLGAGLRVRGSAEGLRQLTHVLLDNAIQYANAGGRIDLRLNRSARRVRLTVRNGVTELPDCPPERLFERFYRADSARTQGAAGCGVGLSAARAIVEAHRGRIFAAYEDGPAVRFTVDLPGERRF